MGTMLMIRSTPRITYKMGTRAGLGAMEDKSLSRLVSGAPSIEVAADFTGIYRILMGQGVPGGENCALRHYQSTSQNGRLARVWQGNVRKPPLSFLRCKRFAFAAAGH